MIPMAWNPEKYNQFKSERFQPFFDCLNLVVVKDQMEVIDLGCGTGELTAKLFEYLPVPKRVHGIDSSEQMLRESQQFIKRYAAERDDPAFPLRFQLKTIEEAISEPTQWDLIFSNAAIQWVADHRVLLPRLIGRLRKNGQIVIQIPSQHHNKTNQLLEQLASTDKFTPLLANWKRGSPVLDIGDYASILYDCGGVEINVFEKVYPVILRDAAGLYDWVSGTALLPYIERMSGDTLQTFISEFKAALLSEFPGSPLFYPFKRIIMSAVFPGRPDS
jgi:trans-aconitate 2-methyltransferase